MTTFSVERLTQLRGSNVYSSEGDKIGSVDEIYVDEETDQPEWIGLGTGLLGKKRVLVPVEGADLRGDEIHVPYSKDQVKGAPNVDADEVSQETEQALYSHYGLGYSERRSDTGLPEGGPGVADRDYVETTRETATAREGDVVRQEEELRVGKREAEVGRARLRKWVETEPVATDVTLERERARVTREPIDERVSGAEIGEEEVEVGLREEQPVVEKETVAKERIGLEKDVETERETVGDEVRKERIDVEGDIQR